MPLDRRYRILDVPMLVMVFNMGGSSDGGFGAYNILVYVGAVVAERVHHYEVSCSLTDQNLEHPMGIMVGTAPSSPFVPADSWGGIVGARWILRVSGMYLTYKAGGRTRPMSGTGSESYCQGV